MDSKLQSSMICASTQPDYCWGERASIFDNYCTRMIIILILSIFIPLNQEKSWTSVDQNQSGGVGRWRSWYMLGCTKWKPWQPRLAAYEEGRCNILESRQSSGEESCRIMIELLTFPSSQLADNKIPISVVRLRIGNGGSFPENVKWRLQISQEQKGTGRDSHMGLLAISALKVNNKKSQFFWQCKQSRLWYLVYPLNHCYE